MIRPKMKWVPKTALEELQAIKMALGIDSDATAFEKMSKYSKVGRELDRGFFGYSERIKPKKV